jgi:hypothetical protein
MGTPASPPVGQTIDHYEIQALLGQGGMGVVYRARDTRLGRAVALKLLPPEWTSDPDRKRRFLQEARAACAVNHPALTQIYDVGENEGGVFIAMELVEGRTVESLIRAQELDLPGTIEIGVQVAGGLQKAHAAGIIHRDVKPSNVMVTPDGHAKLLDFGLAKVLAELPSVPPSDDATDVPTWTKTRSGQVMGTVGYMSPEQARGLPVDQRSDIFSLGVMLYEMTTGRRPFAGANAIDQLHAVAFEEAPPATELRPGLPPGLDRAIARCLRKSPDERYPDCTPLIADLKTAQREAESGVTAGRPLFRRLQEQLRFYTDIPLRERVLVLALGGIALVVLVLFLTGVGRGTVIWLTILALFAWRRLRHQRPRLAGKFTRKARRLPEVRVITLDGLKLTVVTHQAVARTYVRLNALLNDINGSMFFGDPFVLVVRDGISEQELHALLSISGVLFARDPGDPSPSPRTLIQP